MGVVETEQNLLKGKQLRSKTSTMGDKLEEEEDTPQSRTTDNR